MNEDDKYPCPNCNREIFPGTTTCPYCNTPLTIFKYARAPINHVAELDKAVKALITDVAPGYVFLLHGAGILATTFLGFFVFLAVNYAPFLVLPMDYVIGTVFITLFPALLFNMGVLVIVGGQARQWLETGLFVRHQSYPKTPQLCFALAVWLFVLGTGAWLLWNWPPSSAPL